MKGAGKAFVIFCVVFLSAVAAAVLRNSPFSSPREWSETARGVKTRLDTAEPVIALTFDACGSAGDGYDAELLDYLVKERVPATLFINARWIDKHPSEFIALARDPLFEIENHGMLHKPCSINGRSVYGIKGTANPAEVRSEVEGNALKIERLTGRRPRFYRSGTAYYDEKAVALVEKFGYQAAGFSVLGDCGATYSRSQVKDALASARAGDIIIAHMNHPEKETAEGVMDAVKLLKKRGLRFVRLDEYPLR
ncbi:MAG: polysaccharide deacetylase family protein [Candidatus Omnitrophota bacterium]